METIIFKINHVIQGGEYSGIYHAGDVREFSKDWAEYLINLKVAEAIKKDKKVKNDSEI